MRLIEYKGKIYRIKKGSDVESCCDLCAFEVCTSKLYSICVKGSSKYYFKEVPGGIQKIRENS